MWLCGVGALAVMRVRGWRRIRAAARASTPWTVIHVGVQPPRVQIRSSPDLLEPGVVGLWRPMLMLPAGIEDRLTAPQLNAVLAHEWCHIRRWDNLAATIHMIVETAFWFHPLVWWIGARLVDERERACDEHVLQVLKEPRAYAEAILGVCRLYVASPVRCVSGVTGSNLEKRMEDIMSNRVGLGLNFARRTVLALIATLAVATPLAVGILTPAVHAQAQRGTQRKAGPAGTKEAALKDGLFQLRHAIDQYHSAKNAYPPSLDSLVSAGYIKKIPTDPFTNRTDSWRTVPPKRDPKNPTGGGGIFDVRSGSTARAKDGTKYSEW
jgi:hypothetical protein